MKKTPSILLSSLLLALVQLITSSVMAQCTVFDYNGAASSTPTWYACSGTDYTLNLASPSTWASYTINWGDGSPIQSGTNWAPPQFISHNYLEAVQIFNVTITNTATGCVVNGTLVMEEATSASIQIPVGGHTSVCTSSNGIHQLIHQRFYNDHVHMGFR